MNFEKSAVEPALPPESALFFLFSGNQILVKQEGNAVSIPILEYDMVEDAGAKELCYLGTYDDTACYCAPIPDRRLEGPFRPLNLRGLYGQMDPGLFQVAGYARQIYDLNINFRYCGRCAAQTKKARKEHMRECPVCSLISYPRISPAILVAVIKEDRILLARGINFPNPKMYSVLAGFANPGETLEECAGREIFEETGIRVKNIRYFGSQPWPFPDSLMIAFTAEYDQGEIDIDTEELADAAWFTADRLPLVPGEPTLSGELIQWFVRSQKERNGSTL